MLCTQYIFALVVAWWVNALCLSFAFLSMAQLQQKSDRNPNLCGWSENIFQRSASYTSLLFWKISRISWFALIFFSDPERASKICPKCGSIRDPTNSVHRIKSKKKFSKSHKKAMKLHRRTGNNNSAKVVRRFLNSRSKLLIHCKICLHMEKIPVASRAEISEIRNESIQRKSGPATPCK